MKEEKEIALEILVPDSPASEIQARHDFITQDHYGMVKG